MPAAPASSRVPGLDGVRALSLLLVVQAHWAPWSGFANASEWGRDGLLVFFVLSGFLITRILIGLHGRSSGANAIKNFWARRFFRIQPIYYLALTFVLVTGLSEAVRQDAIWHALFLNNFSSILLRHGIGEYGPAWPWWSLAVEEQFYIGWAPIIIFLGPRSWKAGIAFAFLAAFAWRLYAWHMGFEQAGFLATPGNLDSLAAGALVAVVEASRQASRTLDAVAGASLLIGSIAFAGCSGMEIGMGVDAYRTTFVAHVLGDIPVYLVVAPLVYFLMSGRANGVRSILDANAAQWLGKRSYGAYVLHQVAASTMQHYFPAHRINQRFGTHIQLGQHGLIEFVLYGSITLLLAAISYRYFEMPILKMRDRIFPEKPAAMLETSYT